MWKLGLKIFAVGGAIALLITIWNYFWVRPEAWNATAKVYLNDAHTFALQSAYWHGRSDKADSVIDRRDKSIGKYKSDSLQTALYADSLTGKYNDAVAASDAKADVLSNMLAQNETYRNYIANGTLKRTVIDIPTLSPLSRDVILASLKTSNRERIQRSGLDSMARAVGQYRVQSRHQTRALAIGGKGFDAIEVRAKVDADSRFIGFKTRRTKSGRATLVTIDSTKAAINRELTEESELEKDINRPKQ